MNNGITNVNKEKVKVLPLDKCFFYVLNKGIWEESFSDYKEILPIFNRTGKYYCRFSKTCWVEHNGRAFVIAHNGRDFLRDLQIMNHKRLRLVEFNAIKTLVNSNICQKELRKIYNTEVFIKELRKIETHGDLILLRTKKRGKNG